MKTSFAILAGIALLMSGIVYAKSDVVKPAAKTEAPPPESKA
jgi:hypothetical protein